MIVNENAIISAICKVLNEITDPDNMAFHDIERHNRRVSNGTVDNISNYYGKETPRTFVDKFKLPDCIGEYKVGYSNGANFPGITIRFTTEKIGSFKGDFFDDTALFGPIDKENIKQMKYLYKAFKKEGYEPKLNGRFIQIFNWRKYQNIKKNKPSYIG